MRKPIIFFITILLITAQLCDSRSERQHGNKYCLSDCDSSAWHEDSLHSIVPFKNQQNHRSNIKKFVFVVPSYNNAQWYKGNLDSIFMQTNNNYRVIYIDDCSPDGTAQLVQDYVEAMGKTDCFTLIRNDVRVLAMANIYKAVHMCEDHEIVVMLDGDDRLATDNVLTILAQAYEDPNVWLTFGSFIWCINKRNQAGWAKDIPGNIIAKNAFRFYQPGPSHLRTFYAKLFKNIVKEDLCENGSFYEYTYDLAMMFPMIEMASERFKFIPQNLYIYNDENSLNDHKVSKVKQRMTDLRIRSKKPYKRIDVLFE